MKKSLCSVILLVLMHSAHALELEGVKLPEQIELAGQSLQLNGAGVRKKMVFDVYVAALYTVGKHADAYQLLAQKSAKRLQLTLLRTVEARALVQSLKDGLKDNLTAAQYAAHSGKIAELEKILLDTKVANSGDVINLDFVAGQGCRIQFQGRALGVVAGDDFARDLLLIWLGSQPVQDSLKMELLGR